jgi:hypothetical protein
LGTTARGRKPAPIEPLKTEQTIDFKPILAGELYGPLRDAKLFNRVQIDPEVHTLVRPNGADFDPATLHDWPVHAQALKETGAALGADSGLLGSRHFGT